MANVSSSSALAFALAALANSNGGGGGGGGDVTPYTYAQQLGYLGTEDEFNQAYMNVINLTNGNNLVIDCGIIN